MVPIDSFLDLASTLRQEAQQLVFKPGHIGDPVARAKQDAAERIEKICERALGRAEVA